MKKIMPVYLFIIACIVGMELSFGIMVAPTIFNAPNILGDGVLTHFQSGQLMSSIFLMYNKFLIAISVIILIFEMVNFNNNKNENFKYRLSYLMLALIHMCVALIFVLFFTDFIMQAQAIGVQATATNEFKQIHSASEWSMKILLIVQAILFFFKFKSNEAKSVL